MISIQENISLAALTTFRIGGTAKFFAAVSREEELSEALRYAKDNSLKVFVLGGGSNILFSDRGFDGLVVKVENKSIEIDGTRVMVGAGAMLMDVVLSVQEHALAGMELLAGIPGTIGGAVRGNAGAFGAEIGSFVTSVNALDRRNLEMKTFMRDECGFAYRQSVFKKHPDLLVFSVELALRLGNQNEIGKIVHGTVAKREAKHPQHLACAGSFFMNPLVHDKKLLAEFEHETGMPSKDGKLPAGWLIDHVGLRGKKVGGAMVSEMHPNYILNIGTATAEDIVILSSLIKQRVRTQLGVQLREEVQFVGF